MTTEGTPVQLPGTVIPLPVPPGLTETLGYRRQARYVAFYWLSESDDLIADDGRIACSGERWAFMAFRRHPAVAPILAGLNLGASDHRATHVLVIDQQGARASVATISEASAFLEAQHPVREASPQDEVEAVNRLLADIRADGWTEVPVDTSRVAQAIAEQRGRLARLVGWLDLYPIPPSRSEGREQ
jgi:hypothetical protein